MRRIILWVYSNVLFAARGEGLCRCEFEKVCGRVLCKCDSRGSNDGVLSVELWAGNRN